MPLEGLAGDHEFTKSGEAFKRYKSILKALYILLPIVPLNIMGISKFFQEPLSLKPNVTFGKPLPNDLLSLSSKYPSRLTSANFKSPGRALGCIKLPSLFL